MTELDFNKIKKNQNVDIIFNNNHIKVVCLQNSSTPGIIFDERIFIKKGIIYNLYINGKSEYFPFLWVKNVNSTIPFIGNSYGMRNYIKKDLIIPINPSIDMTINIGILFENPIINASIDIYKIKLTECLIKNDNDFINYEWTIFKIF